MSTIDEVKGKLTDGEYKNLCDQIMIVRNKQQDTLYRIWYVEVDTALRTNAEVDMTDSEEEDDDDAHRECTHNMVASYYATGVKSTVVRLPPDEAKLRIDHVQSAGQTIMDWKTLEIMPKLSLEVVKNGRRLCVLSPVNDENITVVRIDKVVVD